MWYPPVGTAPIAGMLLGLLHSSRLPDGLDSSCRPGRKVRVCPSVHSQKSRVGLLSCCRTPEWLRLAQTLFHLLQPCSSRDTQSRVLRAVSRQVLEISKEESPQPLATCTSCPTTAKVPYCSSVLHSDRTGLYHICLPWLCIAQDFFRVKG